MQGSFYNEINLVMKTGFQIICQIHKFPSNRVGKFYKNVYVARWICFPSGIRPEYTYRGNAVLLANLRETLFQDHPYFLHGCHDSADTR